MAARRKIYISYTEPDRPYADRIFSNLNRDLVTVVNADGPSTGSDWKALTAAQLTEAELVVVVVGETTHQSSFVEHEARIARKLNKPVVVVKLEPGYVLPSELYDVRATWTDVDGCGSAVATALEEHNGTA